MGSVPAAAPEPLFDREVDVRYYADLLWRERTLLVALLVAGLGLGLLAGQFQTAEYRAAAMIQIEPPVPTFLTVTDALVSGGSYWQHADFYNTQFKILRSSSLGRKAAERLYAHLHGSTDD